jgi:hypothetical protein
MTWTYSHKDKQWVSDCGLYLVWQQSRPLHGPPEWAAAVVTPDGSGEHNGGEATWLTEQSESSLTARLVCQDHKTASRVTR